MKNWLEIYSFFFLFCLFIFEAQQSIKEWREKRHSKSIPIDLIWHTIFVWITRTHKQKFTHQKWPKIRLMHLIFSPFPFALSFAHISWSNVRAHCDSNLFLSPSPFPVCLAEHISVAVFPPNFQRSVQKIKSPQWAHKSTNHRPFNCCNCHFNSAKYEDGIFSNK